VPFNVSHASNQSATIRPVQQNPPIRYDRLNTFSEDPNKIPSPGISVIGGGNYSLKHGPTPNGSNPVVV